jgi:hypothetical protein
MRRRPRARSIRQLIGTLVAVATLGVLLGLPSAAFSSGGYRDAVLSDNPMGYWRLAESSGTTITDELGAGHSGSYTGAVTLGQTSPITSDSTDTAAYFNGGWGAIPYYADLNPTGNKLSIEFWWKGAAPDGAQFAVLKGYTSHSDPYYQYGVGAGPSGTVRVVVDTSGSFNPWDTGVSWPGDGSWHQIVLTYDGSVGSNNLKLYIDKTLRAQTNKTGNVRGYSSALGLMDILNLGSGYQTTGRLDEVAIYNSALSADRVSAHYDAAILPAAPTNTTLPPISGTAIEGQTLSADNGSWTGNPTSYSHQWRRCDSGGANCADISGATDSSYALTSADVDSTIRVAVTATNAGGSTSATSRATAVVAGSNLSLSYKQSVVADNPVGFWRLSESSGTTITDELSAGHGGSYSGAVTLGQSSPILSDQADTAAYFNGGWGAIPYYADLNPTANELSIEFWWKGSAPSAARFMVLKSYTSHADPYYQYGLGDDGTGKVRAVVDTSGSFNPWDTGIAWPGDGAWHQIVLTYDGSLDSNNLKLYVDATLRAQTNRTGNVRGYSSALGLMDILNLGSGFSTSGRLDEVAIYNSALSSARVTAHFAAAFTAPANTTVPSIGGTTTEGHTLSTSNGSWTGNPTSYSYQWRRCDSGGSSCSDISGATSSSYVLATEDVGQTLRVVVTATNAGGSGTANSAATDVIAPYAPPENVTPPAIAGTTTQGWTLTASTGTWTRSPSSLVAQWLRCDGTGDQCSDIDGASGTTYVISEDDVGHTLRVRITATNAVGSTSASSSQTDIVVALTHVSAPVIADGANQPGAAYNGPYISGTQWVQRDDGSYELHFQRRATGSWESGVYSCMPINDWPWNTCGLDNVGYDSAGYYFSFRKEIWDEFGPASGGIGVLQELEGETCGEMGLGGTPTPEDHPCYAKTWDVPMGYGDGDAYDNGFGCVSGDETDNLEFGGVNRGSGVAQASVEQVGSGVIATTSSASSTVGIDTSLLPEGETDFRVSAVDQEGNAGEAETFPLYVDRTSPDSVPNGGVSVSWYDRANNSLAVAWDPGSDPDLGDGSPGCGVTDSAVRYSINGGSMTDWETTDESQVEIPDVAMGDSVDVEVRQIDAAGNESNVTDNSLTVTSAAPEPVVETDLPPGEVCKPDESTGSECSAIAPLEFDPASLASSGEKSDDGFTYTRSRYENDADVRHLRNQGCSAAAGASGLVVLHFGRPAYFGRHYGTISNANSFLPNPAIRNAVNAFAKAFVRCSRRRNIWIDVALGTSNSCLKPPECHKLSPSLVDAGDAWNLNVRKANDFITEKSARKKRVLAVAADDIEPGFADTDFPRSDRFALGYNAADHSIRMLVDYGSVDPGQWTDGQVYKLAQGRHRDFPLPQTYVPGQIDDWFDLSVWGNANGSRGRLQFLGIMSEWRSGGFDPSLDPDYQAGCGLTPHDGYFDFLNRIEGDGRTFLIFPPFYATDIVCQ